MFIFTLSDVLYVAVGGALLTVLVFISIANRCRQLLCKHDGGVNETQACEAICRKCGKNLGFIGSWREVGKS